MLTDWAAELPGACGPIATTLDAAFGGERYQQAIRDRSAATREQILALPWSADQAARHAAMAAASVAEQQRIEASDSMLFEQCRVAYLSPDRLRA